MLARRVRLEDDFRQPIERVAGVDAAFPDRGRRTRAAVVVMTFPTLEVIETGFAEIDTTLPYIPGLLSFRELPAIAEAIGGLRHQPELVLCDGQGIAHPRRFGLACHLGVELDLPTIGVAKSRLHGTASEPRAERGAWEALKDQDEVIGCLLRTRDRVRPLYVSPGHRVSIKQARQLVLDCGAGYRLPEPVRLADRLSRQYARHSPRRP